MTWGGGGIFRLKQHFDAIRGQIKPCESPLDVIGEIRFVMQKHFEKYGENKVKKRER